MTPDEDRLQRYLEWRRACDRKRAARRRRVVGYIAAPAAFLLAVGLAAWLGRPSSGPSPADSTAPLPISRATAPAESASDGADRASGPAPPASKATPPASNTVVQDSERQAIALPERPTPPKARTEPVARRAGAKARTAPRVASQAGPRMDAPATPPEPSADTPEVAASVAPAPAGKIPADPRHEAMPPSRSNGLAGGQEPSPAELPAAPAPRDVVALPAPPREEPLHQPVGPPPATPLPGAAVAAAPPTVRERVTSWAGGEVQEFRDGVKREMRQFRSGYEKVRDFFRR